eukprot:894222-Lingulodinium_polyedra.AAC.1
MLSWSSVVVWFLLANAHLAPSSPILPLTPPTSPIPRPRPKMRGWTRKARSKARAQTAKGAWAKGKIIGKTK